MCTGEPSGVPSLFIGIRYGGRLVAGSRTGPETNEGVLNTRKLDV